jgi:FkbM family methyltransferase
VLTSNAQNFLGPARSRLKKTVRLHLSNDRAGEARTLMEAHLAAYPDDADIRVRLAKLLMTGAELHAAAHHLTQAHALSPCDLRIATLLAGIHRRLGDHEAEKRFKRELSGLKEAQADILEQQQAVAREHASSLVNAALELCLSSGWPRAVNNDSSDRIADRVLASHSLDTVPLWSKRIPERYKHGDIASLEHIGRFLVGDVAQTINKRLARGMPWELPAVALFMEIALRCRPEALIVDVGANIGTHTVPLARTFPGTVLAFEPVPLSHAFLLENLFLNDILNCIPLQKACSAIPGKGGMTRVAEENPGKAKLDVSASDSVEITTIDNEVARIERPLGFMKIDVEGHETDVLQGAMTTIGRCRPLICCEIIGARRCAAMRELLSGIGYEMHNFNSHDWLLLPK